MFSLVTSKLTFTCRIKAFSCLRQGSGLYLVPTGGSFLADLLHFWWSTSSASAIILKIHKYQIYWKYFLFELSKAVHFLSVFLNPVPGAALQFNGLVWLFYSDQVGILNPFSDLKAFAPWPVAWPFYGLRCGSVSTLWCQTESCYCNTGKRLLLYRILNARNTTT